MSDPGPIPWLCLAVAVLGVMGFVISWITGGEDHDSHYVLYVLMIMGGAVGFLVLR